MTSNTRTTLSLPKELLEKTDELIFRGKIENRNQFVAEAMRRYLASIRQEEIDLAFSHMKGDREYQQEALQIEAEFAFASWEALNQE